MIRKWLCRLLECTLILCAGYFAYLPTLRNGFVSDDEHYILTNPQVTQPTSASEIFKSTFPPNHPEQGLYRPLTTGSYRLDFKIWNHRLLNGSINGFHFTNILIHSLNGILLSVLLASLGIRRWLRTACAVCFVIHPAWSEAVAWASGRSELLSAFFCLLALVTWLRFPHILGFCLQLVFWILAMMAKENAIVLPALMALLWIWKSGRNRLLQKTTIICGMIQGLVFSLFWWIRSDIVGSWSPPLAAYEGVTTTGIRIMTALKVLWKYFALMVWPAPLSLYHPIEPVSSVWMGLAWLILWVLWVLYLFSIRKKTPWLVLGFAWFALALFPVSNLVIPIGAVFNERFLYLPGLLLSAGAIVTFANWISQRKGQPSFVVLSVVALALFSFGVNHLWNRLSEWNSNLTLWQSALKHYPESYVIKAPLAEAMLLSGDFSTSRILIREAIESLEKQPESYQRLMMKKLIDLEATARKLEHQKAWISRFIKANELAQNFMANDALKAYHAIIEEFPEQAETYEALGDLYVRLKNPVAARQNYEKALQRDRHTSELYAKYAGVLSELGHKAESVMMYEESLKTKPNNFLVHYLRGCVLVELKDYDESLVAFKRSYELSPEFAAPRLNAASVLIHLQRYDQARELINHVIELSANKPEGADALKQARDLLSKIPSAVRNPTPVSSAGHALP